MKKGFTLIELLAVIVILAIIALIATPIILGIINDAREESNERSIELYASAVRNAIASYQLTGTSAPKSFADLTIEYDGNVECATEELYSDGSFYIANCTVNGTAVDYTYGEQQVTQVYKPQYYSWLSGTIGQDLPDDAKQTVSEINSGHPFYLGFDVEDEKVSAAYTCFTRKGTEYCLKGYDAEAFATNTEIIKAAYSDVVDTGVCSFDSEQSSCTADGFTIKANSDGHVDAVIYGELGGEVVCAVYKNEYDYGQFECFDLNS